MAEVSAVIYGCAGPVLTEEERSFFRDASPWGFILFARNIETPGQVARLTAELRETVGWDAPILIDQEGGRVARLRAPHWREWPPVREQGERGLSEIDVMESLRLRSQAIAAELLALGIDVNCVPLLDVPQPNAHPIIGDRALGETPSDVALRGREVVSACLEAGLLPVVKHLPGHGRALHDSHLELPRVTAPVEELRRTDFLPFRSLRDAPLGMTAHITYEAIDPDACVTLSPRGIAVIRDEIGFDGLLMTDDLSMHALKGPMGERARRSLQAGCDLVLHCNGDMGEMRAIQPECPPLGEAASRRSARALALRGNRPALDAAALRAKFDELIREPADA